jgi:uncharacterized protein
MEENIQHIIELAKKEFIMEDHSIHGFEHWEEVEKNAIMLANQPGVDLTVVRLFAYIHDCRRQDDHIDPEHGQRSAQFVLELKQSGELDFLNEEQVNTLWFACKNHNDGVVSDDVTIGTCFDSDRIELIRCGMIPRPVLMSTKTGIRIAEKMQKLYNLL